MFVSPRVSEDKRPTDSAYELIQRTATDGFVGWNLHQDDGDSSWRGRNEAVHEMMVGREGSEGRRQLVQRDRRHADQAVGWARRCVLVAACFVGCLLLGRLFWFLVVSPGSERHYKDVVDSAVEVVKQVHSEPGRMADDIAAGRRAKNKGGSYSFLKGISQVEWRRRRTNDASANG